MLRYFIGITGISTAGKSTLGATLLSESIVPKIFPIPHTTRRTPRIDDDPRLIRCVSREEFGKCRFLTVDQNYGTLESDYKHFLASEYSIAVSVVSCNEIPELRNKISTEDCTSVFFSLTLTDSFEKECLEIERRLPNYFSGSSLCSRIERDKALARDFFFNEQYLKDNQVISLSLEAGDVLQWVNTVQNFVPIVYNGNLKENIAIIKSRRR